MQFDSRTRIRRTRGRGWALRSAWLAAVLIAVLLVAACQSTQPSGAGEPPAAEEEAATEAPAAEEEAAEETPAAEEEAAEETPAAEEEAAEETPAAEEEAAEETPAAEEEAAEETPDAEEEAAEETPAPEEEAAPEAGAALPEGDAEAGKLVLAASVGCGCHFNGDLGALAGGNPFEGDFGVVHSRNLTPDATGIADFTDEQLADAIRFRKGADGRNLFIMPAYAGMADQDVADLIAYLRSLDPVENEVPARELAFDPPAFELTEAPPAVAPDEPVAHGEYLVSLARCTMCHTPSNEDGSPNMDLFLAGAPFRDGVAPNLTPDEGSGLGLWTDEELVEFFATGLYFDGSEPGGAMKNVIDRGTSQLTDEHRQAIVAFLRSLPPVVNEPAPAP